MMLGTVSPVNKALMRPILLAGVERRLFFVNALLSFPLIASTHFELPWCLLGVGFFIILHSILTIISKHDPYIGKLFKRSTRYQFRGFFPAHSHPMQLDVWAVKSVSRPW